MFPYLRLVLLSLWTSTIAGVIVVVGLTFGLYGWGTFFWANVGGLVLGTPASLVTWAIICPERLRQVGWFGFDAP